MIQLRNANPERTVLLGVEVDCLTSSQAVEWLIGRAKSHVGGCVVTVNLDHLRRCRIDPEYANLVANADLVVADGMPLVWASRLLGRPRLPERVAGSSLTLRICETAADRDVSVFLLGGNPGVANNAARILAEQYPGLRIAGTYCPAFGFERNAIAMEELRGVISSSRPDIVLVALGSPKQERLISEIRDQHPGACWMGVGISLSFITGDVTRAPVWMQRVGLEWVHRLVQEPRRLFTRYVCHGIPWGFYLLMHSAVARFRNTSPEPYAPMGSSHDESKG